MFLNDVIYVFDSLDRATSAPQDREVARRPLDLCFRRGSADTAIFVGFGQSIYERDRTKRKDQLEELVVRCHVQVELETDRIGTGAILGLEQTQDDGPQHGAVS
jgi:hypothetical protein